MCRGENRGKDAEVWFLGVSLFVRYVWWEGVVACASAGVGMGILSFSFPLDKLFVIDPVSNAVFSSLRA